MDRRPLRVAPRPASLTGREGLLASLAARLSAGSREAGPQVAVLFGLGGVGKTSVAVEYAHRQLAGTGLVWQFPAEDPAALAAGFADLAAVLGVRDLLEGGDPVAAVHAVLAVRPGRWLLIFDNAAGAASLARVLPPAGDGQVLITTQNPHWPGSTAVDIQVLDTETAAGFLTARTGFPDQSATRELAEELGGLPLALEQAAAYLQGNGRNIAWYLTQFRDRRADLLDRGEAAGYDKRVATTWSLAFARLSMTATGLLRLLACCAPEAIPLNLLMPRAGLSARLPSEVTGAVAPLLDQDSLAAADAITALRRFSLISPPAADGSVSVHRLVQAITRDQMHDPGAGTWRQVTAELITAALPDDPAQPATWPVFAALLPHALTALAPGSEPLHRVASYLGYNGSYAAARDLQQQILTTWQHDLGAEHPDTLTARVDLARWTGEAGDAASARDQFAALAPVRERISGAEHPDTLAARSNVARWTAEAGDTAGARDQFAALLPVRERISGAEHPDTLTARANLAESTGMAGDAAGARDQYAALVPIRERVSGANHPYTLMARASLADWSGEAGNVAAARDQYAALLPVVDGVLGPEHPYTLTARAGLARWSGEAGDAAGARDQYAALVPIRERVSGTHHPDTLTAHARLDQWTSRAQENLLPAHDP